MLPLKWPFDGTCDIIHWSEYCIHIVKLTQSCLTRETSTPILQMSVSDPLLKQLKGIGRLIFLMTVFLLSFYFFFFTYPIYFLVLSPNIEITQKEVECYFINYFKIIFEMLVIRLFLFAYVIRKFFFNENNRKLIQLYC